MSAKGRKMRVHKRAQMCTRSGFFRALVLFLYPCSRFLGVQEHGFCTLVPDFVPSFRIVGSRNHPLKPPFWKLPFCSGLGTLKADFSLSGF